MTPLLNCQDLSKSFGNRTLFEGLSFSVFPGGPSRSDRTEWLWKVDAAQNFVQH